MKINKILILVTIFLNSCCIVLAQSFEKDWQWLKFAETTAGTTSSAYENALLNLVANNLKDSLMVSYYDSIATRLNTIIPQIENKYGIASEQYWKLIDACSLVLTESVHNHVKIKKRKHLVSFLKSLEMHYHQAETNEYIFTVGLSDVYSYLGDFNKAIYITHHKNKDFEHFLNELFGDTEISHQTKRVIINCFLDTNYENLSDRNKSDIAKCLLGFDDIRFGDLKILCFEASKHGDYHIFDFIENSNNFSNFSVEDRFEYYEWNSTGFHIKNDTKRCVDYLLKAIRFAESNNRDDLNWHYHGNESTHKTHNWLWVAYYYENELFDKTNALLFYDKNIEATKNYYGEKSAVYYKELIEQANRYDLWRNDIERVAYYDSLAVQVSQKVFGIDSEEYVNSLSGYLFCLRRQNHYLKALSLCNDYFSVADSTNAYSHKIYNQAAMCYQCVMNRWA